MILASLINAGVNPGELEESLKKNLKVNGWKLRVSNNSSIHFPVTTLTVEGKKHFSSTKEIAGIIKNSSFSNDLKVKGLSIFGTLVKAEAKVHEVPEDRVHFHEINSIDTLVDIMGAVVCLDKLKIEKVISSPVNLGSQMPATIEIVKTKKLPVFSSDSSFEMTTPTGAAIISALANEFGEMPLLKVEKYGFGSGTKKLSKGFSIMKVVVGIEEKIGEFDTDLSVLLETNIDDMDPRIYPYVMEKLFSAGAKDVWFTQVLMKKGRPGIILSALCSGENEQKLAEIIFSETTTLGIRRFSVPRYILKRKLTGDKKIAYFSDGKRKIKSEYEVIRNKALKSGQSISDLLI